jgi:hypothetical protein
LSLNIEILKRDLVIRTFDKYRSSTVFLDGTLTYSAIGNVGESPSFIHNGLLYKLSIEEMMKHTGQYEIVFQSLSSIDIPIVPVWSEYFSFYNNEMSLYRPSVFYPNKSAKKYRTNNWCLKSSRKIWLKKYVSSIMRKENAYYSFQMNDWMLVIVNQQIYPERFIPDTNARREIHLNDDFITFIITNYPINFLFSTKWS